MYKNKDCWYLFWHCTRPFVPVLMSLRRLAWANIWPSERVDLVRRASADPAPSSPSSTRLDRESLCSSWQTPRRRLTPRVHQERSLATDRQLRIETDQQRGKLEIGQAIRWNFMGCYSSGEGKKQRSGLVSGHHQWRKARDRESG